MWFNLNTAETLTGGFYGFVLGSSLYGALWTLLVTDLLLVSHDRLVRIYICWKLDIPTMFPNVQQAHAFGWGGGTWIPKPTQQNYPGVELDRKLKRMQSFPFSSSTFSGYLKALIFLIPPLVTCQSQSPPPKPPTAFHLSHGSGAACCFSPR